MDQIYIDTPGQFSKKEEPSILAEPRYSKHYQNLQYSPIIEAD